MDRRPPQLGRLPGRLIALLAIGALSGCGAVGLGPYAGQNWFGSGLAMTATSPFPLDEAAGGPRARVSMFQVGRDMPFLYYGQLDTAKAQQLRQRYKLVVIQPMAATPQAIKTLQAGPDGKIGTADDVIVLGYFSAGEDTRIRGLDPKYWPKGDGTGPRVDPRPGAPYPNGSNTMMIANPLGNPSPGGTGFASYYLDDNDQDGLPDCNKIFGGAFVNAGDPAWFKDSMNFTAKRDKVSGLNEIVHTLGCDGFMLDTFDTPAPNGWTDDTTANKSKFEWTAPGFQTYAKRVRQAFPDRVIMINRGMFYFNPDLPQYKYCPRGSFDLLLFESFYSDSAAEDVVSPFYGDNRAMYAPRINAEADRPDGFRVVTLGYKRASLVTEIPIICSLGWFPSFNNPNIDGLQTAVPDASFPRPQMPTWDSTYLPSRLDESVIHPRDGVQQAVQTGAGAVTVRWDVAEALMRPVRYNVYYQPGSKLNFNTATKLTAVNATIGNGYANGTGPNSFPYQYTVTGLSPGPYVFAVRAQDASTPPLEENNTHALKLVVR